MKIERLSFSNINSLAGEFEIDFTHPELSSQGIFCITGPTGSGKTTIMDAICFALYRRTPRMDQEVSKNNNEILTKGAQQCQSQLTFSHEGKRYLAAVSHKRTRRGAFPFGQATHELFMEQQPGEWQLIANNLKDVKNEIHRITKLDFVNFTRCIMLAQGQFAAFLKADEKERAAILTAITHTEHYAEIGAKVRSIKTALENEIAATPEIKTMDDDARAALEANIRSHSEQIKTAKKLIDAINAAEQWHQQCESTSKKVQEAEQRKESAHKKLQELLDSGAEERLMQANAAQKVKPEALACRNLQKSLTECENKVPALQQKHQQAEHALQQAKLHADACAEEQLSRGAELNTALQQIHDCMRPQEEQLKLARQAAAGAESTLRTERKAMGDAAEDAASCAHAYTEAQKSLARKKADFDAVEEDAPLGTYLPDILAQWKVWENDAHSETPLAASTELQQSLQLCRQSVEEILQGRTPQQLEQHSTLLKNLQSAQNQYLLATNRAEKAQTAYMEAQAKLAKLPSCDETEQRVQSATERWQLLGNLRSMEEKLSELYTQLKEGKLSACPCCGSTTYGERHVTINQDYRDAELLLKQAQQELATLQKQLREAEKLCAQTQAAAQEAQNSATSAQKQLADALQPCGFDAVPENLAELIEEAQQQIMQLRELQQQEQRLSAQLHCAGLRDAFYLALAPCSDVRPATAGEAHNLLRLLQNRKQDYEQKLQSLCSAQMLCERLGIQKEAKDAAHASAQGRFDAAQSAHLQAQQAFQSQYQAYVDKWGAGSTSAQRINNIQQEQDALRNKLSKAQEAHSSAKIAATETSTALQNEQSHIADLKGKLQASNENLQQLLTENGFETIEEYNVAETYIAGAAQLTQQLNELKNEVKTAEALEAREKSAHQSLLNNMPEHAAAPLPELQESRAQQQFALQDLETALRTLDFELLSDNQNRVAKEERELKIAAKRMECERWSKLYDIMGNNADGFMRFAQQISLEHLITHANRELKKFSGRFKLVRSTASLGLDLHVIDYELDDEKPRSCSNLSGGESFIVSLALALGLSSMSSASGIDTLFLDEGFGTLDNETLNQVLSSLDTMRAEGKMIGIITHMEKLSDRIASRLAVQPRAGGLSSLLPHPAVTAKPGL